MELKETTQKILALFGADDISAFLGKVRDAVFSGNSKHYFEEYLKICPDLNIDWMQRLYQFWLAKRKQLGQDYTPAAISRLVAALTHHPGEKTVADYCCGSGSLTLQKWAMNRDLSFVLRELDSDVMPILLFNLCLRNIEATVTNENVLTGEVFQSYKVIKGKQFGTVQTELFPDTGKVVADTAIANPPFNVKSYYSDELKRELPPKASCNFAFVQRCLDGCRRYAAVILPCGALTSDTEIECRKHFVQKGWLKAAIALPENMFESTSVQTCILLFDKQKTEPGVMAVDASKMTTKEERLMRGEAHMKGRVYKKGFNSFSPEQILALLELTEKEQGEYSKLLTPEMLESHKYRLLIGPYLEPKFDDSMVCRDFNEIIADINRVARERNVIKLTVNKVWAKELGLDVIHGLCEQSNLVTKRINESLKLIANYDFKEQLAESEYLRISAPKVFSIENTDKEFLSSILKIFIPIYKQHIFYLNEVENRYLAELRDAMLPYLMNGKLEIGVAEQQASEPQPTAS